MICSIVRRPIRVVAIIGIVLSLLFIVLPVSLALALPGESDAAQSPAYYVSRFGNDGWSGLLSEPNADGTDGPFVTLDRARDAMRADPEIDVTYLRDGTYYLSKTLQLGSADSGVSFIAYPGEKPVISGGEQVFGFVNEGGGLFSAAISEATGLDLIIGGLRQRVAQSGDFDRNDPYQSGWLFADSAPGGASRAQFSFQSGDLGPEDFYDGIQVQIFKTRRWMDDIRTVQSVDFDTRTITLNEATTYTTSDGSTFRLLNNPQFITNTGEFAWRDSDGRLVVKPENPETFESDGAVVPRLGTLINLDNADGVSLLGLTFADGTYDGNAMVLRDVEDAMIGYNSFENLGTAIKLIGSSGNTILGNEMSHLGAGGITLFGSDGNEIFGNYIHHIGEIIKRVAGISGRDVSDNTIGHNEIAYTPRYGISIKDHGTSENIGNMIEYNRILYTNLETADTGAIAMLGRSGIDTQTIIRYNYIEHSTGLQTKSNSSGEGEWVPNWMAAGIYLDDLTSGVEIYGNFIKDTSWTSVLVHGGSDVLISNNLAILQDNVSNARHETFLKLQARGGLEMTGIEWTNNIIYAPDGLTAGPERDGEYWRYQRAGSPSSSNNLLYNVIKYDGTSTGEPDQGSIIANSRLWRVTCGLIGIFCASERIFVGQDQGRYSLAEDSLAHEIGFNNLPWQEMGRVAYDRAEVLRSIIPPFWFDSQSGHSLRGLAVGVSE